MNEQRIREIVREEIEAANTHTAKRIIVTLDGSKIAEAIGNYLPKLDNGASGSTT